VDKRQLHRETATSTPPTRDGGNAGRRRRRRRQRPALRGPRRASGGAGVYSRFGRMEIWDCSILGCAPRRCSVIAEPNFFPLLPALSPPSLLLVFFLLFFYFFFFFSLFRIPSPVFRSRFICVRTRPSLSTSLYFLFLLLLPSPSLSLFPLSIHWLSMYDATNEGIFNPANHQQEESRAARASHFSYTVLSFLFFGTFLITSRLLAKRVLFIACNLFFRLTDEYLRDLSLGKVIDELFDSICSRVNERQMALPLARFYYWENS